jgi:hypothetical protein
MTMAEPAMPTKNIHSSRRMPKRATDIKRSVPRTPSQRDLLSRQMRLRRGWLGSLPLVAHVCCYGRPD